MSDFLRSRADAFKYAFAGWWYVIRTQRNAWIHAVASVLVIAVSIYLQLDRYDWVFIFIAIAFVWTAEFLNTAIELVVDLSIQEHHPLAKASKDVGAATVLIAAITAAIIGVIILGPPLLEKLQRMF
jgi:diacylglycerol kinase